MNAAAPMGIYPHLTGAARDEALLDGLKRIVEEKKPQAAAATHLMGQAAKGQFKAGWHEDAEQLIGKALGSPALHPHLAGAR